ncbi:MAG: DMT family transporter [Cohaesibacteraceae bacterium]
MNLYNRPYLLLILTILFWAGNTIAGKLASGVIPPFTLTFMRWLIVAIIAYIIARPHLEEHRETIKRHWPILFLMGLLGFSLFNTSLYTALTYTTALNVAIVQSAFPAVIIFLMFSVYRERITAVQGLGVLIASIGVVFTAAQGSLDRLIALEFNRGDIIMVLGVFLFSIYSILLRKKPKLPWQVFLLMLAIGALLGSIPLLVIDLAAGRYPAADWRTVALMTYVVLFPSFVSQVFWVRGVELIGAGRASLFINLIPVFGALLAVVILGEVFQTYHAVGLVCVVGGIFLAEWAGRRRAQQSTQSG